MVKHCTVLGQVPEELDHVAESGHSDALSTHPDSVPAAPMEQCLVYLRWVLHSEGEQGKPQQEALRPLLLMADNVLNHLPCSPGLLWRQLVMVGKAGHVAFSSTLSFWCECSMSDRHEDEGQEHCVCDPGKRGNCSFNDQVKSTPPSNEAFPRRDEHVNSLSFPGSPISGMPQCLAGVLCVLSRLLWAFGNTQVELRLSAYLLTYLPIASVEDFSQQFSTVEKQTVLPKRIPWEMGASRKHTFSASHISTRLSHRWIFWTSNVDIAQHRACVTFP